MSELPTTLPPSESYGQQLLGAVGSYWAHYFGDRDRLKLLFYGDGQEYAQTYLDYLEAVATVSRANVPVFHTEYWYLLVLSNNDGRNSVKNVYGQDDLRYGEGGVQYGAAQTGEVLFPLPTDELIGRLTDIPGTIYNRVLYPSKSWVNGTDFDIDTERRLIRFREDPFTSGYAATSPVYDDNGEQVDEIIGLWVYNGKFDLDLIYNHWGFAINMLLPSSENYKALMNAIWDAYVRGSNIGALQTATAAMLGVPFVLEPTEVIEDIVAEPTRRLITTDKHVYTFSLEANVIVSIGQTVFAGEELTDAVVVSDLSGNAPEYDTLSAIAIDKDYLSGGYFAELVFENQEVDVEYLGVDSDNKAVVTFRIQGFPSDVDLFFEKAQTIAKTTGKKTLAELLDLRDDPSTQPLPGNLPTQLNPLEFVLENIMRNNLWLIKVRTSAIAEGSPGLGLFKNFRDVVPPHTSLLIFVEIEAAADTIDLSQAGDEESAGVEEATDRFYGIPVDTENLYEFSEAPGGQASYQDVVVRVYKVSEVCK